MPILFLGSEFRKFLSKARRPRPRQTSIYRWLTVRMTLLVLVTIITAGVPTIWITWRQLNEQLQLRVQGAQSSTQAFFATEQRQLLQLTQLISERPTLCTLLQHNDVKNLSNYLDAIRQNSLATSLIVATADGQLIFGEPKEFPLPDILFEQHQLPYTDFVALENPPRVAIFAISEVVSDEGCEKGLAGQVIAIQIFDQDFLRVLAKDTGLEQSLIIGDRRVASSLTMLPDWPLNPGAAVEVLRTQKACCTTGSNQNEPYYVGLAPLINNHGAVIALSEVALLASSIRSFALNTIILLVGICILVTLGSTGLALLFTRRITGPLRALSAAAERMGAGDLETPVPVASGFRSIDRLADQLERSRRSLDQNQQFAHRELRRITDLLSATREGVVTINMDGMVTWANSDACQILGYDINHLLRKHYMQVFRPAPGGSITLGDVLQPSADRPPSKRLTILNAQDRPITLKIFLSLLETEDYDTTHHSSEYILILRDVSEEDAVNRLRSEFLANVAHEFRTPLSAISASSELLVDEGHDMTSDELSHLASAIRLSATHLQTLVDNLLESAIIEAGVFHLRYRPLQLQDILQNVVEMMSPLIQRRQQHLDLDAPKDPTNFWADPVRLTQVLVNLLANASKFSPTGAKIALTIAREVDKLTFAVLDSGPGLPLERFGDLFNRFVTGGQSRSGQYGIGMGLSIVKAVAEAHGGRVGAENRAGGGAKVWFTIPLKQHSEQGDGQ
jgi:signal transduction histidine kinase